LNVDETDCIFCKIARGEMDAEVVHDEDEVLAFKDIRGLAPVHVLVIPRQHLSSLEEITQLPERVARRLLEVCSEVAGKLGVGESGYAVRINNGPDAGQGVFHLHLHVLGGKYLEMP
jgi:histidine triad (HIT) family protein